jgi:hypothetical protein
VGDMSACCYRRHMLGRCGRTATQAFDVWSWFKDVRNQTPTHYETCDKHAYLFEGYTGGSGDLRTMTVKERCEPTPLSDEEVQALRDRAVMRGLSVHG